MNIPKPFRPKPDHKSLAQWCLQYWQNAKIYDSWQSKKNNKEFVLHDGPPYANGDLHVGHAVNKILKDSSNRFMAMKGYRVHYFMGWDCNGLPIESKVEQDFKKKGLKIHEVDLNDFFDACRNFANHWVNVQRDSFLDLGVTASDNFYTTIQPENQIEIVKLFHRFAAKGLVYRKLRPIMWSCEEETALAEAEIEYIEKESTCIDVLMPIVSSDLDILKDAYVVIWTTTPWSIPANRAVAYNPSLLYAVLKLENGKKIIVSDDLLESFIQRTQLSKDGYEKIGLLEGHKLQNTVAKHPLSGLGFKVFSTNSPLYPSDHVTNKQGSGFVHIAPDHGDDDFKISQKHGIECCNYILSNGKFADHLPAFLANKFFSSVEVDIINNLSEIDGIIGVSRITHSYPHSWRSRKPLICRATDQWFINISKEDDNLQKRSLEAADLVKWIPSTGKDRFTATLKSRDSWCISRQRLWGTPMCMFYCPQTGQVLLDEEVMKKTIEFLSENGIAGWWDKDIKQKILGDKYISFQPTRDIIDVWFESGSTNYFVLRKLKKFPADLYLEGSDQHRGWFQSSMIESCLDGVAPPYKCVKTHGYVVDSAGKKMSKSQGNGKSPREILDEFGADVLRLWVLRQDTTNDITFSNNQILDAQKIEHKFRNTLKFLIANGRECISINQNYEDLSSLEKWVLNQLYEIQEMANSIDEDWNTHSFLHKIYTFFDHDMSRLYFDIRKDVLYWEDDSSAIKKQVRSCLEIVFQYCIRWLCPIMPFGAEEAWQEYLETNEKTSSSIHIEEFLKPNPLWKNFKAKEEVDYLLSLRKIINSKIELLREKGEVKSSIDCHVEIQCNPDSVLNNIETQSLLKSICIISKLTIKTGDEEIFNVKIADGYKCAKCKRRVSQLSNDMCTRCSILFNKED